MSCVRTLSLGGKTDPALDLNRKPDPEERLTGMRSYKMKRC